jgi:hypothetical protein
MLRPEDVEHSGENPTGKYYPSSGVHVAGEPSGINSSVVFQPETLSTGSYTMSHIWGSSPILGRDPHGISYREPPRA